MLEEKNIKNKKLNIINKNKYIELLEAYILSATKPAIKAHIGLKYEKLLIVTAAFSLL